MSTTTPSELTHDPQFHRTVLDHLPTPVLVVREDGVVTYGNRAMAELSGRTVEQTLGLQMLDVIHPDDVEWVIGAFATVRSAPADETGLGARRWAPVRFRILDPHGAPIPIEVTGVGALDDPALDGIVYSVRSSRDDALLADVFSGLASPTPIEHATPPLVERLALPPLELSVAVFEQRADGGASCVAATHEVLRDLPADGGSGAPWASLATSPARADLDQLPHDLRATLVGAGFRSCFHAGAPAPDHDFVLRLVACSPRPHIAANGALARIAEARELLAIIATKAHNDRVIANNAMRDDLTGLPNRLGLVHSFDRLRGRPDECALMFVDVDDFKAVNDRYGHAAGDAVLSAIGDRLVRTVRADDYVSRIGGDEFVVVLTDAAARLGAGSLREIADRVVQILREPVHFGDQDIPLAASVGVACADGDPDLERLLSRADSAMYRAKRAGGGRHHLDVGAA